MVEALAQLVVMKPPEALICGGRTDEMMALVQSEGRSVGNFEGTPIVGPEACAEPLP